jgi:hypothetical protein
MEEQMQIDEESPRYYALTTTLVQFASLLNVEKHGDWMDEQLVPLLTQMLLIEERAMDMFVRPFWERMQYNVSHRLTGDMTCRHVIDRCRSLYEHIVRIAPVPQQQEAAPVKKEIDSLCEELLHTIDQCMFFFAGATLNSTVTWPVELRDEWQEVNERIYQLLWILPAILSPDVYWLLRQVLVSLRLLDGTPGERILLLLVLRLLKDERLDTSPQQQQQIVPSPPSSPRTPEQEEEEAQPIYYMAEIAKPCMCFYGGGGLFVTPNY